MRCDVQAVRYRARNDVSVITIPGAGHEFFLEREAPLARAQLSLWLAARGF